MPSFAAEAGSARERRSAAEIEAVFSARGWLAVCGVAERRRILDIGRQIFVERGQRLFAFGDGPGGIFGVVSGGLGMEACSEHHVPRLGHIMRAGNWLGHGPALRHGPRTLGCRAIEDSVLLAVPLPPITALMTSDADVTRLVGELASRNSKLLVQIACDLLIADAARRLAAVLVRETGALDGVVPGHPGGYLLTQSEVGEMANVSRHHVNRLLGRFAALGWIEKSYNRVKLLNIQALYNFAYSEKE